MKYLIAYSYSVHSESSGSVHSHTGSETVNTPWEITEGWIEQYAREKAAEIKKKVGFPFDPFKTKVFVDVLSFSPFTAEKIQ